MNMMMSYPFALPSSSQYQTHPMKMATTPWPCLSNTCSVIMPSNLRFKSNNGFTCKASSSSSSFMSDLDLYELLGIESSCDQSQVKMAYRTLQKRCHPDIAGPVGHDMAIILNQAYAILSDPNARLAYDKEQAKCSEFKGFTGRPIYSAWYGSESEKRAIFVDEIKCVGCLKCALLAEKTFAIESAYGRARVVAQWADSPHKIEEAIESCPVNCISFVERSNLAALEFLMSKQPRGNVRVGAGNTAGARVSNIFVDVDKFQNRFQEAMQKASKCSKENDLQRESRMSAYHAIRSISNWLYWQTPNASGHDKTITRVVHKLPEPDIGKLRDAAARMKIRDGKITNNQTPLNRNNTDEYWAPSTYALPPSTTSAATPTPAEKPSVTRGQKKTNERDLESETYENQNSPIRWAFPTVTAMIAVATVRLHEVGSVEELKQHVGGSLALEIVNSPWMQCILAAATWYMIGMAIVELVAIIGSRNR